jgi:hypothetical protein
MWRPEIPRSRQQPSSISAPHIQRLLTAGGTLTGYAISAFEPGPL